MRTFQTLSLIGCILGMLITLGLFLTLTSSGFEYAERFKRGANAAGQPRDNFDPNLIRNVKMSIIS
jgi:hypothetical protein